MMKITSIDPTATLLTRASELTGKLHNMELPVSANRIISWIEDPASPLLQHAFPELNADQCEFIKTGITTEEWDALVGDDE